MPAAGTRTIELVSQRYERRHRIPNALIREATLALPDIPDDKAEVPQGCSPVVDDPKTASLRRILLSWTHADEGAIVPQWYVKITRERLLEAAHGKPTELGALGHLDGASAWRLFGLDAPGHHLVPAMVVVAVALGRLLLFEDGTTTFTIVQEV